MAEPFVETASTTGAEAQNCVAMENVLFYLIFKVFI